jgi:hypothetical protein
MEIAVLISSSLALVSTAWRLRERRSAGRFGAGGLACAFSGVFPGGSVTRAGFPALADVPGFATGSKMGFDA